MDSFSGCKSSQNKHRDGYSYPLLLGALGFTSLWKTAEIAPTIWDFSYASITATLQMLDARYSDKYVPAFTDDSQCSSCPRSLESTFPDWHLRFTTSFGNQNSYYPTTYRRLLRYQYNLLSRLLTKYRGTYMLRVDIFRPFIASLSGCVLLLTHVYGFFSSHFHHKTRFTLLRFAMSMTLSFTRSMDDSRVFFSVISLILTVWGAWCWMWTDLSNVYFLMTAR